MAELLWEHRIGCYLLFVGTSETELEIGEKLSLVRGKEGRSLKVIACTKAKLYKEPMMFGNW